MPDDYAVSVSFDVLCPNVSATDLGACLHFCIALLTPLASALAQHVV